MSAADTFLVTMYTHPQLNERALPPLLGVVPVQCRPGSKKKALQEGGWG